MAALKDRNIRMASPAELRLSRAATLIACRRKVENAIRPAPAGISSTATSRSAPSSSNLTTQDVPAAFISQADGGPCWKAADHHLTMAEEILAAVLRRA